MKHLILACLLFGSAYSYEARLFGQFGIENSPIPPYPKKYFSPDLAFKFGYEQNIINHHIIQAYYATNLTYLNQLLGVNYIYELPLSSGFLGFYGGFDLGVIAPRSRDSLSYATFDGHLNIGTRYRVKSAFVDLGLYTLGFRFSVGIMFNL